MFSKFKKIFINTLYQSGKVSINQITKRNLPFFIGWITLLIWLDCYALPVGEVNKIPSLSKLSPASALPILYAITATVFVLLFDVRKLLPYTKISAFIAMFGILTVSIFGNSLVSYIGVAIAAAGLGHIFATTAYGFFMILNNSERLYSISSGILLSKLILLLKANLAGSIAGIAIFEIMQFVGFVPLVICTWFYGRANNYEPFELKKGPPLMYYTVLILAFIVLVFNDFLAVSLWRSLANTILPLAMNVYYVIGVFAGVIITIFLQQFLRSNMCYALNFSLVILTLGFVINVVADHTGKLLIFSALIFGVSYAMGFISLYYILGIILKKLRSLTFLKIILLSKTVFFMIGIIINKVLTNANSQSLYFFTTIISIAFILMVFALTPFFTKILYFAEWTDDLHRPDVTHVSRLTAHLAELKLSPKEIEVCVLLLEGYTMRQISALLPIAYSTVNTYCTSIYRKLEINSKTELVVRFSKYI